MKYLARFLLIAACVVPNVANSAPVPAPRGNNLTAYNGASGATNNNTWNALMNVRSGSDAANMPVADFGNCNAIVLRCASPKCANGGCADMSVASTIVAGCVRSNESCAQYGDDLVQYISAQLVAQSTAKSNAASAAAANVAAAQSAQQIAAMQQQMQQMQSQMAAQNAETVAQLQSALEEQKQLTADAIASATAAQSAPATTTTNTNSTDAQTAAAGALTTAQQMAAERGVSADILAREQVTGQIMSSIENAETQLKALKTTMAEAFSYAGCDAKGDNCTGPKRVKMFKQKAGQFFEPYENVLDELYDALITAQAVGVDIKDIYMMLNDSCNVWGQYLCSSNTRVSRNGTYIYSWPRYNTANCVNGKSRGAGVRGNYDCYIGMVIPPEDDATCTLQKTLTSEDEVQRNWLWEESGDMDGNIRVGCASSALEQSKFFRNRKKGSSIDIETMERIIEQDAPSVYGSSWSGKRTTAPKPDGIKYCAVSPETIGDLEKAVSLKKLPDTICVKDSELEGILERNGVISGDDTNDIKYATGTLSNVVKTQSQINCESSGGTWFGLNCMCPNGTTWHNNNCARIGSVNLVQDQITKELGTQLGTPNFKPVPELPTFGAGSKYQVPAYAANNGCDNEANDRINPEIALCSTHVYNIGGTTNKASETDKQLMRNVVALKTTVMTQQMYKQYEYLETMIRRFKTQLEKAVLTTKLQAAGADTSTAGGSSYSGVGTSSTANYNRDSYVVVDGARDCNNETTRPAIYECLQSNISIVINAANERNISDATRQLKKDIEVARRNSVAVPQNCNYISNSTITNCAYSLRSEIMTAAEKWNRDNRTVVKE